jgi:hypothetical protein
VNIFKQAFSRLKALFQKEKPIIAIHYIVDKNDQIDIKIEDNSKGDACINQLPKLLFAMSNSILLQFLFDRVKEKYGEDVYEGILKIHNGYSEVLKQTIKPKRVKPKLCVDPLAPMPNFSNTYIVAEDLDEDENEGV